jgi:hypothetical protein
MSGTQTTPQTATNPIIINLPPIDPNYEKEKIQKSFPKKTMMVLSILQIICGCLAVIFQVSQYLVDDSRWGGLYEPGWGIWTGIIFAASGLVGLIGAFRPSKCMVIAFLVLNIIASLFTLCLIVPVAIGISIGSTGSSYRRGDRNVLHLYCLMLIVGLVQAVTSIVAAGYSCSAICCGQNQNYPGVVIYAPANSNQSHFAPVALNVQSTNPGNFVYAPTPNTTTDSTYVDVPFNTQKATENEKNDQQDCPPNYEEANGQTYQRF